MTEFVHEGFLPILEGNDVVGKRSFKVFCETGDSGPFYYVICDLCGIRRGTTVNANLTSFGFHRGSNECAKEKRRREKAAKRAEKAAAKEQRRLVRGLSR